MAKNENVFLPIWLRHYSQFFSSADIFVLDHESDDGSIEECRARFDFNCLRVEHPYFCDFVWYTNVIAGTFTKLLEVYENVLFSEPDEIIWHPQGLDRYIQSFSRDAICATGYEIHHKPREEAAIDPNQPILGQRRWWNHNPRFSKPLLGKIPILWNSPGFHTADNCSENDPELLLLHLHRMDYDLCRAKHERSARYKWDKMSLEKGWGAYNQEFGREFDRWYWEGSLVGNEIVEIPEELRKDPPV